MIRFNFILNVTFNKYQLLFIVSCQYAIGLIKTYQSSPYCCLTQHYLHLKPINFGYSCSHIFSCIWFGMFICILCIQYVYDTMYCTYLAGAVCNAKRNFRYSSPAH